MPGSVYLKTLHDLREQMLAWGLGLALLAAANVLLYPTVQGFPGLVQFLENMPSAFKAMIGDVRAMAQLEGFLRIKLFDPLPLLLAVFVISQGAALIGGEIELKSIDLLLARPVPRRRVVLGKLLALLTATVVVAAATAAAAVACAGIIGAETRPGWLLLATANCLPLTWVFAALAVMLSCLLPRPRQAAMIGGAVVVALYVFETLRQLVPVLRPWDEVSLFAQSKAGLTAAGTLGFGPILALVLLAAVLAAVAVWVFERRDLA